MLRARTRARARARARTRAPCSCSYISFLRIRGMLQNTGNPSQAPASIGSKIRPTLVGPATIRFDLSRRVVQQHTTSHRTQKQGWDKDRIDKDTHAHAAP